jgi:hypothetical protein
VLVNDAHGLGPVAREVAARGGVQLEVERAERSGAGCLLAGEAAQQR